MHHIIHRQRELRFHLLNAAYGAFVQDPDGFVDVSSLSFEAHQDDPASLAFSVDFTKEPPTPLELRAATYYVLERGLVVMMGADGLLRNHLKPDDLYVHITANGVDAFEGTVLSREAGAATRPVGFRIGASTPGAARPDAPAASAPEDARLEG